MPHSLRPWNGLRRSRIVQVLVVTLFSLSGGIALIATSSGDADARTPKALATCAPTWGLTTSGPAITWSTPSNWCGPVIGEYPGQDAAHGGTQTGVQTVNIGAGSTTVNFDSLITSSLPINLSLNGFGETVNVLAPLTLQGSNGLGSAGNIVNVPAGGSITLGATDSIGATGSATLNLTGGTITNDGSINLSTIALSGGTLQGSGTLTVGGGTGTLTNTGATINPGNGLTQGVLSLTGNYAQSGTGALTTDLYSAASFDQFNISGSSTFGGVYNAVLQGGYQPANGTLFNVSSYASLGGDTATYNLPTYPGGGSFTHATGPTALQLQAVVTQADVGVTKVLASPIVAGQNATYTVTVTNNGPSSAAAVSVSDPTPAGLTFVSNSGGCATAYPCSLGTLINGQVVTITSTYAVPSSAAGSTVTNSATVSSTTFDPSPGNNTGTTPGAVVTGSADMQITKALASTLVAGQNATYTVTVKNNGPSDATVVSVADPTPAGLTFVSNSGGCVTAYPCALGTVLAGQTVTITSTYSVASSVTGSVSNTSTVSSTTPESAPANNTSTSTNGVTVSSDVQVTKSGPATASAGTNVLYTITVGNAGPSDATAVVLNDPTPAGLTFVSATGACVSFPCTIGAMASGGSALVQATYAISPTASGPITNTATVTSTSTDPAPGNNTASTTMTVTVNSDVSITKTLTSTLTAGQNATYSIVVTNNGPSTATGVTVSDPTPAGLTFVSNAGACATAFPCSVGTLAPAASVTITSTWAVSPSATGTIVNSASVTSTSTDSNGANNTSTSTNAVTVSSDIQVTKTGPPTAFAGTNILYTITVGNAGPSNATAVVLNDPTPPGLTFVSATGACLSFPCTIGAMANGGTALVQATYAISPTASGSITNTATVTSTSTDPTPGNNTASTTMTVTANSDVSITKTLTSTLTAGQNATYNIVVTNNGPSTATGVTVSDPTPAGLTFVSNAGGCTTPFPCSVGTLAPAASVTITSTWAVSPSATGTIVNSASVTSTSTDSNGANNTATSSAAVVVSADVSVTKSGPATGVVGSNVTFNIVVTNAGPATATGVTLNDVAPAGLIFQSAGGACSLFPCTLGTMLPGATQSVAAVYKVNQAGALTNSATVTATSSDPTPGNNTATASLTGTCPTAPVLTAPANASINNPTFGTLTWSNVGAGSYKVYLSVVGSGCSTLVGTSPTNSFNYTGLTPSTTYEWHVEPDTGGVCPLAASSCNTFTTAQGCAVDPPTLIAPAAGATVLSPVTFRWSAVPGAVSYSVVVTPTGAGARSIGTTTDTSFTAAVPDGVLVWQVVVDAGAGCQIQSALSTFSVCSGGDAPIASLVSEVATQQKYTFQWQENGATRYEVDESGDEGFSSVTTTQVNGTSLDFQHAVTKPTPFFYRVRGFSACLNKFGGYSETARVVIAPILGSATEPSANGQAGSTQPIGLQVKIPGFADGTFSFTATVDQPWLTVTPASGLLPPAGLTLIVTADPTTLPNGTWNGTLVVTIGSTPVGSGVHGTDGIHGLDNRTVTVPISINLVTPVATAPKGLVPASALIIPSVGHLDGLDSRWQSDIRLANVTNTPAKYNLVLTPTGSNANQSLKQTSVTVAPGATMALDDIIRNWFGVGSLGESSNGVLQITPADTSANALNALVSSRTYDVTGFGTFGQFIPAVPFSKFAGKGTSVLGMQQIAQSSAFRTNLGLVEGSGQSASLTISAFDGSGKKLLDVPLDLKGGEQKQLNSFLAQYGVSSLTDGRIEVKVANGLGKVTAYASVIDQKTGDPLLVAGQPIGLINSSRYVLPAVMGVTNSVASWRTDMRLFNPSSTSAQPATLTFYPEGNGAPSSANVLINPGEVKRLDDVLQSLFGVSGASGAVQVNTPNASNIMVTGRTYNQTSNGTYGQFVPAVTVADAVGKSGKSLNLLQVEESVRYRTTIGVAEVTGNAARVEVSVVVPGSKVSPLLTFDLAPNEVRQYDVLHQLGLDNTYNARIGVRVLDGVGKVTAYGSVVDLRTQDPTYVPAQ